MLSTSYVDQCVNLAISKGAKYVMRVENHRNTGMYSFTGEKIKEVMFFHFFNDEKKEIGYISEITEFLYNNDKILRLEEFENPRVWDEMYFTNLIEGYYFTNINE